MLFVLRHILPFFCPWTWEETLNELSMCFFQTTVKEFKTKIADEMVKCVGFNSVLYCFVVVYKTPIDVNCCGVFAKSWHFLLRLSIRLTSWGDRKTINQPGKCKKYFVVRLVSLELLFTCWFWG
jgi:hypothetical protein